MNRKALILTLAFAFSILFATNDSWSWDDELTHKDITDHATDHSVISPNGSDFLLDIGFKKSIDEVLPWDDHHCDDRTHQTKCRVIDWLKYGAEKEDAKINPISGRFNNHFHNPITGEGLDDYAFGIRHVTGKSGCESDC